MSTPEGRRHNGLPSSEWGALVDLDPRLSDALLESLAAEGVAAFVEPAQDTDRYTRASTLPNRPLDRLWVDPSQADLARGVVASEVADLTALISELEPGATAHGLVRPVPRTAATRVLSPPELPSAGTAPTPSPDPTAEPTPPRVVSPVSPPVGGDAGDATLSDDEVFAQIIAGFSLDLDDPVPRWPVSEDLSAPVAPEAQPKRRRTDRELEEEALAALPDWVEPEALEDTGHFEPPPPPRVPRLRPRTIGSVLLVLAGLLVMFSPFTVGLDDSSWSLLMGLGLTVGGASLLVASMRDAPPTDSGPDDGAVV